MTNEEWQILRDRNKRYDGRLFCGRADQKVVCNPSCPIGVRTEENTVLFHSLQEALDQGYTPCACCQPGLPPWRGGKKDLVQAAKDYIEAHSTEKFSLAALSGSLYINGSYLLRVFKEYTGHTLLWYHNFVRCEQAKQYLAGNGLSVSAAGEKAGFVSSAHFSHVFRKMTGMTPTEYRAACRAADGPSAPARKETSP